MSIRLQILIENQELKQLKRAAAKEQKTLSEWVRGVLREHLATHPEKKIGVSLEKLHAFSLPAPPIEKMLQEIEKGRKTLF